MSAVGLDIEKSVTLMLSGHLDDAAIISLLQAMPLENLQPEDIATAARTLIKTAQPCKHYPQAVDVCGTGGTGAHARNVSTASAFVLAACGMPIIKHGNRSASSKAGSADVLQALHINLSPSHAQLERAISELGLGFLFAPDFYPALGHLRKARKSYGQKTIFNLLGPLCNPAQVGAQLVGVYDKNLLKPMAQTMRLLGKKSVLIVHAQDGLDECSISAATDIAALKNGEISYDTITPEDAGLITQPKNAIQGGDAGENAQALLDILHGQDSAYANAVQLNCAMVLCMQQQASNLAEGVAIARHVMQEKKAFYLLEHYRKITRENHDQA
jgi:anthranilate phosphoribosyltransferase